MTTDERAGQKDPAHETVTPTNDAGRRCPACDEPVESVREVGPVTWELEPCGHQIDDRLHAEFWEGES